MVTKVTTPLVVTLVVVTIAGWLLWRAKWQTYHFASVDPGVLYRDGNRGLREFAHAIERGKIRTIVILVDDMELSDTRKPEFAAEMEWAKQKGLKIERIPIELGGWPTKADVERFLSVVSDKQNQPVLVHCAQGVRRTGMMCAAYQRRVMSYDVAKTSAAIVTFGHSRRTVGDVERFIDGYDPGTGAVPEGLPIGKE